MSSKINSQLLSFNIKYLRFLKVLSITFSLLATSLSFSQGLLGAPGGTGATDLSAIRGATTMGVGAGIGAAGLGLGAAGFPAGLLAIPVPTLGADEDADLTKPDPKNNKKPSPLPPNEFQKYLLQTTGQILPLFGADFFENFNNINSQYARSPVGDDYVLGAGDQLLIRVWGSANSEATVTVDRQGAISIPKLGTLRLAGVKAGQIDAVVKAFFSKYYKDIEVSVALGKLRKITVFVVGQSRNPGSYALSSQATLTSALFASGGPSAGGSIRRVQLKRQGQTVAEFDLYDFLGRGDKSSDIKLQDGDVLFYPRAAGFMALLGKVNNPGVYEIKVGANVNDPNETLSIYLNLAGGLPVTADPRRATLERVQSGTDQPRRVQDVTLADAGLQIQIKNGDVLTVPAILPELANAITLRGAVAQPTRMAWRQGMRISDVISKRSLLINPETVRKQNEVLFDSYEQERTARVRARVPKDLAVDRVLLDKRDNTNEQSKLNQQGFIAGSSLDVQTPKALDASNDTTEPIKERELSTAQLGKPILSQDALADRIGRMNEQINLDYAVIERFSRDSLEVSLLPFHLGQVLTNPLGAEDRTLEPGDVITVFTFKDIQVPISRQQIFVRIEGEVNRPGVYQLDSNKTLQQLIEIAGGTTADAFPFATSLFREETKKTQKLNLDKILRKMEVESSASIAQITQSNSGDAGASMQAKIQSLQQSQKQAIERFKNLKPEGRIALDIPANPSGQSKDFPAIKLENSDRIVIPPKSSFVQVFGSVNTESAILYRKGLFVKDYLAISGVVSSADVSGAILVRANGNSITNQSSWSNVVLNTEVLPGDTIFMPEKIDRESAWSYSLRTAKDFTVVLYQLGLGAAAIKTLRQ